MTNVDVSEITQIAVLAASEVSPDLRVVGVTTGAGGGEYAEILLNIEGCRKEPCRVTLGVLRDHTKSVLHAEIVTKLREHIAEHHS